MKNDIINLFGYFPASRKRIDFPLSGLTTFKTGGNARLVLSVAGVEEIAGATALCRRYDINYYILGGGSNVLISDRGFDGIVLRLGKEFSSVRVEGESIYAEAGAGLIKLSRLAEENRLSGLEFCCGIPGTLGGGILMNAGAYGGEMSDITDSVTALSGSRHLKFDSESCGFSYRTSRFQDSDFVITGAALRLKKDCPEAIRARMEDNNAKRARNTPIGQPSAGSAFKRPKNDFAARLIDEAGLKGHKIGGAEVSTVHAGFIVNTGGGASKDVYNLMQLVREIVYNKFGVLLESEIKFLGDFN